MDLRAALAAFRAGNAEEAKLLLAEAVSLGEDFRALHLAGEVAIQTACWLDACSFLERALRLSPDSPEVRFSLARAQWRAGIEDKARENAREASLRLEKFAPAHLMLGLTEASAGNSTAACRAIKSSGAARLDHFDARNLAVQWIAADVEAGRLNFSRWCPVPKPCAVPYFSVVVCSIDSAKLARAQSSIAASDPAPVEWIVIRDSRSLAESFNRAIKRASGEAILFMHDDVEVLSRGVFSTLGSALEKAGIVGVAGTCQLSGPTIGWSGQEPTRGALAHVLPAAEIFDYSVLNWTHGTAMGIQALDGCFFAARAEIARQIGFDEATCNGFHFYDLDFTYRASRAGVGIGIASEVLIAHASRGSTSGNWEEASQRFLSRHPELTGTQARESHFYAARFTSREKVLAMHREMQGLSFLLDACA